jgi:hypothetical protein
MKIVVAFLAASALAQIAEPEFSGVFFGIASDKLIPLERQTATVHAGLKFGGFGGMKAASQFKPGKSPVRFKARNPIAFIVRSGIAGSTVDPNTIYVLRALKAGGSKRELVMLQSHGPMGMGGADANMAEGVIAVHFEKYGANSLKMAADQPLPPGEYAVSVRQAMVDVFCFGVDK